MTEFAKHEKLLDDWRRLARHEGQDCSAFASNGRYDRFAKDGVLDEDAWQSLGPESKRVLFLLRESYDQRTDEDEVLQGFDHREKARGDKHPHGRTFQAIAQWAYLVHHCDPNPPKVAKCRTEMRKSFLASAVVNLKKRSGGEGGRLTSRKDEISEYCQRDAKLIREQIDIIAPDVIICGGTWKLASKFIWTGDWELVWPKESNGWKGRHGAYRAGGYTVVDAWHPSVRRRQFSLIYDALSGAGVLPSST